MSAGKLYICGTPIGNLKDITLRCLDILKEVDLIAAEDTRHTQKLLNYYQIKTPLTSYHEHNEVTRAEELIFKLENGENIALVTDAGMPGISDPGFIIIKKAINTGLEVIPIPGATAAISALVVSGCSTDRFVFEGFLPRKGKERQERLQQIAVEERTVIFYESPYRIKDTINDLIPVTRDRKMAIVRELTKIHEEKIYGTAEELQARIKTENLKGEIVVIIEGREIIQEYEGWEDLEIIEHVKLLMDNGYTKKKAIKKVAKIRNIAKRDVYKEAIAIEARV